MKKLYYLIILTVILGLVLTGCFLSNVGQVPASEQSGIAYLTKGTLGNPDVFTLYAGQHIKVGTVSVWNDDEYLYVTYNTTGGWEMTETHLAVAINLDDPDGIPQTKKGNPIPGKFPYKHENLNGSTSDEHVISLNGWDVETELLIAAHASLLNMDDPEFEFVGTVDVNAGDSLATCSAVILESGKKYLLEAIGTAFAGDTIWFDAKYSNSPKYSSPIDSWTDEVAGYMGDANLLGLSVDGVFVDWGDYNSAHVYYWDMYGKDLCVPLLIYDTHYGTNEGLLTVNIYLYQEESAWAVNGEDKEGDDDFIGLNPFPGNNWATYITYNSETWTRSGEFTSQRHLPVGSWEYDVSFTKSFNGDFSYGTIVLTDPNSLKIEADVLEIKYDYKYWKDMGHSPNYAAVGTATYEYGSYSGNFMFLIASQYIWMALSGNDYSIPWGVGDVWQSGRVYDILSLPGSYW